MSIQNVKQFSNKLNGVVRTMQNLRSNVQVLVEFATVQVAEHGNLSPLTELLLKTKAVRTIRTATLEAYIMAHVKNIKWSKGKNGKTLSKIKGAELEVLPLKGAWFEHDEDGIAVKELDVQARIKSLLTAIAKAEAEDGIVFVAGQGLLAHQVQELLAPFAEPAPMEVAF